jgi:NAD(P)-dependent dehydrogenase (short-subunit alcohol dehydrogenase family)
MTTLTGKVAIVTGGSAGIGRATAFAAAAEGASVVVADVADESGEQVAAEIREKGGRAIFVHTDVADDESVAAMVARTVDEFGGLDLAFNNAGIEGTMGPTHEVDPANWHRIIAVNLTGVWSSMRHEIPRMLERGGGSIVNCASVAGLVGFAGSSAYTASKHGVVGMSKATALELAEAGIRVNAVCPGVIETEMITRAVAENPEMEAGLLAMEPMGRLGRAEEIADAVVWLFSDRSSFVTGQAIAVDGGLVAR